MGTTAVCALVRGGNAFIRHAGDSRAYLVRDGRLTQLTHEMCIRDSFRDLVRQTLGLYEQEKLPAKATVVVDMHSDGDI